MQWPFTAEVIRAVKSMITTQPIQHSNSSSFYKFIQAASAFVVVYYFMIFIKIINVVIIMLIMIKIIKI